MNNTLKSSKKLILKKKLIKHLRISSFIILCFILIFSSFVYADSTFQLVPVLNDGTSINSDGLLVSTSNTKAGSSLTNTYAFYYDTKVIFVAPSNDNFSINLTFNSNSIGQTVTASNVDINFPDYKYGSTTIGPSSKFNTDIPVYYSISAGISAFDTFYKSLPSNDPIRFPFTLQNGYLFVFDCGQSNSMFSFDLSSKSEEYSDIGSIPFPDTNQSYWFSDSLPEIDETTIPNSSATIISWQKGDKTNIFGQTQDMIATISGTSSGRYLYIYNPPVHYKWSGSSNPTASETINYPMIINGVSENENWYIYDSVARLTDFNQGGSVTGTVTGENIIGSVSSDGAISLVTSSGAIYTQNSGGSTDISGANGGSLAENINGLKETLDNFVNQFIQLLSAPISHIQQLIQSSNQFFDVFSQLFDWLPSELSSVIVSGLIIMVVIGVIKMLL